MRNQDSTLAACCVAMYLWGCRGLQALGADAAPRFLRPWGEASVGAAAARDRGARVTKGTPLRRLTLTPHLSLSRSPLPPTPDHLHHGWRRSRLRCRQLCAHRQAQECVAAAAPAASSLTRHSAALRQTLPAVAVAAFAAFGGVLYGYDTGTISGLLQVRCRSHITGLGFAGATSCHAASQPSRSPRTASVLTERPFCRTSASARTSASSTSPMA